MAAAFKAKGTFVSGTGGVTPGLPAGMAAGDLMLLTVHSANQAASAPSGWSPIPTVSGDHFRGTAGAAGGVRVDVFYRWWQSGDSAPSVADTGDITCAIICGYSGVDPTTPFDGAAPIGFNAAASTTLTLTGITTQSANALVVHCTALDRDAASTTTVGTPSNGNLTGLAERHDQTVSTGNGGGVVIHDGWKASAGASGNTTATQTSTAWAGITLSLRAAPPPAEPIFAEGASTFSESGNVSLTKPAGAAPGSLLMAFIMGFGSTTATITPPGGWSTLRGPDRRMTGDQFFAYIFYRIALGSEGASFTFTKSNTSLEAAALIARFEGHDPADPFDDASTTNNGDSGTRTGLGITTGEDDELLVLMSWGYSGAVSSTPSGMTQHLSQDNIHRLYSELRATAGATGDRTHTQGASDDWLTQMFAIRPPAPAPTATPRFFAQIIG